MTNQAPFAGGLAQTNQPKNGGPQTQKDLFVDSSLPSWVIAIFKILLVND